MPNLFIPTPMRKFTDNKSQLALPAGTLKEVLEDLETEYPGVREQIYNDLGSIKRFINIFVNGKDIRKLEGEETHINEGDEVYIIPAMAGG